MITTHLLAELGYGKNEIVLIMQKISRFNIKQHKIRVRHTYIRKGVACDYMATVKGFDIEEVLIEIQNYIETLSDENTIRRWESIALNLSSVIES